jgi:hypothetical protein
VENEKNSPLAATLAQRVGNDADSAQIADAIVSTWREIEIALTPIIGQRGIATLYKRTLYLTGATYVWLAGIHEGIPGGMDLAPLRAAFARQNKVAATAGASALLHNFHELLASLVGPSLTERLLRSVWANSLSGSPAQDNSP